MGPPIYIGGNLGINIHKESSVVTASMGPPIYIGGNLSTGRRSPVCMSRFNGATDLHRWKQCVHSFVGEQRRRLQWGHRFTSVETIPDFFPVF